MLRKQSYVRLDNVYETNISNLRSYNNNPVIELPAYNWRLDETSYHKLMSLLHLKANEYPPTDNFESVRKTHNVSIPIYSPVPTTTQNLQSARITIYAHGPPPTQDPQNLRVSTCVPDPKATPNLQKARVAKYTPVRESFEPPRFASNSTGTVRQHYDDALANPAIQRLQACHSSPYGAYGSTMQLPLPATYSIERRRSWGSCDLARALVFGLLLWLVVAYAGWLIWHMLGI